MNPEVSHYLRKEAGRTEKKEDPLLIFQAKRWPLIFILCGNECHMMKEEDTSKKTTMEMNWSKTEGIAPDGWRIRSSGEHLSDVFLR